MFTRQLFIFLLVILQLFAPLVHGHTGDIGFHKGLHIPGLESYTATERIPVFANVKTIGHSEGLLVVVASAIKNPIDFRFTAPDLEFVWLFEMQQSKELPPKGSLNLSSEIKRNFQHHYRSAFPPRAPPLYN